VTWILILSYFYGSPAMTWAGDFESRASCEAVGKQWSEKGPERHTYTCLQAKRS
jgi:hypothetical protein